MKARREEKVLVRRMLAGEEAAFDTFAEVYIPAVHRFASNRLRGERELVRDIVQTTMCKAIAKLGSFRGEAALSTWLCACCRNEIAAHFRRRIRITGEVDLQVVERTSAHELREHQIDSPEQVAVRKQAVELVHEALDALPQHYGQALEWKYIEELSVKDIAGRLDLGAKAAESLLTRAREAFRKGYTLLTTSAEVPPEVNRLIGQRMGFES